VPRSIAMSRPRKDSVVLDMRQDSSGAWAVARVR
jgi:hypothetical protein